MEKTRSGGIELGELVSTARSTYAHDGTTFEFSGHHLPRRNVSFLVFGSRRWARGLMLLISSMYLKEIWWVLAVREG